MCFLPLHLDSGYYRWEGTMYANRPAYVQMHPSGVAYSECVDSSTTCEPKDRIPKYQ
jgi:hypothetical protein